MFENGKKCKILEIWGKMHKIQEYFEKGQMFVCDYCMQ